METEQPFLKDCAQSFWDTAFPFLFADGNLEVMAAVFPAYRIKEEGRLEKYFLDEILRGDKERIHDSFTLF